MTPYIVGRRPNAGNPASSQRPTENPRAEDSGGTTLRTLGLGWSAATFGAGAILGWHIASSRNSPKRAGTL